MTDEEFDLGWKHLTAAWPKEAPPAATVLVYQAVLAHLDLSVWQGAVHNCITTLTFFPRPAEIINQAVAHVMEHSGFSEKWARQLVMQGQPERPILFPAAAPQVEPPALLALQGEKRGTVAQITSGLVSKMSGK